MIIKRICFALVAISMIFSACGEEEIIIPEGVIPRDSMAVLIANMHMVEAVMNARRNTAGRDTADPYPYYKGILEENNISWAYYQRSYGYYLSQPELLLEVYDMALTRLSAGQAESEVSK